MPEKSVPQDIGIRSSLELTWLQSLNYICSGSTVETHYRIKSPALLHREFEEFINAYLIFMEAYLIFMEAYLIIKSSKLAD
jgi:hypothetical protein